MTFSIILAAFAAAQSPAAPAAPATVNPAPVAAPAPKMVAKRVCKTVRDDDKGYSRLGSARKECKTLMVPESQAKSERGR